MYYIVDENNDENHGPGFRYEIKYGQFVAMCSESGSPEMVLVRTNTSPGPSIVSNWSCLHINKVNSHEQDSLSYRREVKFLDIKTKDSSRVKIKETPMTVYLSPVVTGYDDWGNPEFHIPSRIDVIQERHMGTQNGSFDY